MNLKYLYKMLLKTRFLNLRVIINNLLVANYIKNLRKKKLTQKKLVEKLNVSFQALSKWETRETLPDVSIMLQLADILETSVNKIITSRNVTLQRTKRINIDNIKEGFKTLESLKIFFRENSTFYRGAIEGINTKMNIGIEKYLKDDYICEVLVSKVIIQYLLIVYKLDESD